MWFAVGVVTVEAPIAWLVVLQCLILAPLHVQGAATGSSRTVEVSPYSPCRHDMHLHHTTKEKVM